MKKDLHQFLDKFQDIFGISRCVLDYLKSEDCEKILLNIKNRSGKTVPETVLIFIYGIKYLFEDGETINILENKNQIEVFVSSNADKIIDIGLGRKVQVNFPERALPILEVLSDLNNEQSSNSGFKVIELGASFGMIGKCLLNPDLYINNKEKSFAPKQQLPKSFARVVSYFGIDIDPPDKDWLIASILMAADADRLKYLFSLSEAVFTKPIMKSSAIGFSQLPEIQEFIKGPETIVVLTSFMIYQLTDDMQHSFVTEIKKFTENTNGIWINQTVDIIDDKKMPQYFLECNGERRLEFSNDRCTRWKAISNNEIIVRSDSFF